MMITASLIIPTHNRSASLKKMLKTLELQSFPLSDFEVIVVADGCRDDTVEMVSDHKSRLEIIVCETPGLGAASARNKGVETAKGNYLIFADDDMELSKDFIREHISAHIHENTVVIGYSPFKLEWKAGIQRLTLREWWEEKFQEMRQKDHRFKYSDLTSGNFSISTELFKKVHGFTTSLLCREDYELGFRLMQAGAEFRFAYTAKAFHNDEVTDLRRSLQRKKSEGIADIQIKKLHPDFINKEALFYLSQSPFRKKVLLKAIQFFAILCDMLAGFGAAAMDYYERFNFHISWLNMNKRLHQYWYLRGLMQAAGNSKELHQLLESQSVKHDRKLFIDIQQGLKKAEDEIDDLNPDAIDIYYGTKRVGTLINEAGTERIKGYHLRKLLRTHFLEQLAALLFPHEIFKK